jgi:hypothetical protein
VFVREVCECHLCEFVHVIYVIVFHITHSGFWFVVDVGMELVQRC